MTDAVSRGSQGGSSRSEAKLAAARENGKKGGRPFKGVKTFKYKFSFESPEIVILLCALSAYKDVAKPENKERIEALRKRIVFDQKIKS